MTRNAEDTTIHYKTNKTPSCDFEAAIKITLNVNNFYINRIYKRLIYNVNITCLLKHKRTNMRMN